LASKAPWVPFPAPGGPMRRMSTEFEVLTKA
jgi:hypothetical protein